MSGVMSTPEATAIAELCRRLPGLLGHGVAITIALGNEEDAQSELLEAWAAAQAIATYADSIGRPADAMLAQEIANRIARFSVDQTMPRGS